MDEKVYKMWLHRVNNMAAMLRINAKDQDYVRSVALTLMTESESLINGELPLSWKMSNESESEAE